MLSNKKITLAISLLTAIGLWIYVIGAMDPITKKTFNDIPINIINMDALHERGLDLYYLSVNKLDIKISGNNSKMSDVDVSNFKATIDANKLEEGENKCSIDVEVPTPYKFEEQSVDKVTVIIEKRVSEEKPVKVEYDGKLHSDKEPKVLNIKNESVTVQGAKTLVDKVSHVKASIDVEDIGDKQMDLDVPLTPVNGNDEKVYNLELSHEKTRISIVSYYLKTVNLEVQVKDDEKDKHSVTAPKTVVIKGMRDNLAKVDKIESEILDVTEIKENTTVDIKVKLPDNIYLVTEKEQLKATVKVKNIETTESFMYNVDDIQIRGNEKAHIDNDKKIKVTVTAQKDILDKYESKDFKLYIEVDAELTERQDVKLEIDKPDDISDLKIEPDTIEVVITD